MHDSGFAELEPVPSGFIDIPEPEEDEEARPTPDARPAGRPKPHEERIVANCARLKSTADRRERDQIERDLYADLLALCRALLIKKYGYNGRIDVSDIAHNAATSALMTVILRDKEVFSWVQLLKKMCHDWACKWIKSNLYGAVELVSIDETREDEDDGGRSAVYDLPHYDVDPAAVRFLHTHIAATATRVEAALSELTGPTGNVMARLVMEKAFYGRDAVVEHLPPRMRARVNLYAHQVGMILRGVADPGQLRKEMF